MTRYVSALDAEAIDRVAEQTLDRWGGGRRLEAHRARIGDQIARAEGRARYAGLVDDEAVVCSTMRHALTLDTPEGAVATVGIGAVFTPPCRRRQGLATALVSEILDEARRGGCGAALLFSDVAPAMYERLGFVRLSSVTWSCRVGALPAGEVPECHPSDDLDLLCGWRRSRYRTPWLQTRHDPSSWRYGAWRNGTGGAMLIGPTQDPCGYVVAHRIDDVLWVDDADADDRSALWACLAAMAEGATTVAGWLRADMVVGPFVAHPRAECVPMVAPLDDRIMKGLRDWRSHFSSLDHL